MERALRGPGACLAFGLQSTWSTSGCCPTVTQSSLSKAAPISGSRMSWTAIKVLPTPPMPWADVVAPAAELRCIFCTHSQKSVSHIYSINH